MDEHAQLQALLDLAESLGVAIRHAAGAFEPGAAGQASGGALVKLYGREVLFLDATAPVAERIAAAAGALKGRKEIENVFLPPEIRQLIERT
jgi:hypothetical protein